MMEGRMSLNSLTSSVVNRFGASILAQLLSPIPFSLECVLTIAMISTNHSNKQRELAGIDATIRLKSYTMKATFLSYVNRFSIFEHTQIDCVENRDRERAIEILFNHSNQTYLD